MQNSKPIIATIYLDSDGQVSRILPGELVDGAQFPEIFLAHLTEDHIDELLQINQAYYKRWLNKAILNFPIL